MPDLKCNLPESSIKNHVTISGSTINSYEASCSVSLINSSYLVLTQYVNQEKLKSKTNLIYYIYVINNLRCAIYDIKLKDILPKEVEVVYTSLKHGQCEYSEGEIFYNINYIKPNSFCKIIINLYSLAPGTKINSIEVICKKSKYTVNNPCKVCNIDN